MKVVTLEGLAYFLSKLREIFVGKEDNKGLSQNDFTDADKEKLDAIPEDAEANTIDSIVINGTAVVPDDKTANINLDDYLSTITSAEIDTIINTVV